MKTPEDTLSLIIDLLFDLKKDQSDIKESTIKNTASLDEHMRRTQVAEERLEKLEDAQAKVEKQAAMLTGFLKISGGILALAGALLGIVRALRGL